MKHLEITLWIERRKSYFRKFELQAEFQKILLSTIIKLQKSFSAHVKAKNSEIELLLRLLSRDRNKLLGLLKIRTAMLTFLIEMAVPISKIQLKGLKKWAYR